MPTTMDEVIDAILRADGSTSPLLIDLATAARANDTRQVTRLARAIDWSVHSPDELDKVFSLALSLNMTLLARDLAQQGVTLFPEYEPLRRAARMFERGQVRKGKGPPLKGLKESHIWLTNHAEEYRGQWIAVNQGQLIGVASTIEELRAIIRQHDDAESTIIHWVIP